MSEEILINVTSQEVRVARLQPEGILQDIYVERHAQHRLVGNIYKGRVHRLLPGIKAAFIDIGLDRSGFLHISDVGPLQQTDDIRNLLRVGQDIIVQVYKEALGSKGVRLTTQISLPSRYLVLTPDVYQIAVSQKILDEAEQERLMKMITPGQYGGYIFRTSAVGAAPQELEADKLFLDKIWADIILQRSKMQSRECIYQEIPSFLRLLRDLASVEISRIRVDDEQTVKAMRQFAQQYVPNLEQKIEFYAEKRPIFDIYGIEEEIEKALQRKVTLTSGGHLIFDQTEAMTTIDVNTGSYVGQGNPEELLLKTNLEAVATIAHQVRLRNLGGIIIIDFIDMEDPSHKIKLLETLQAALAKDPVYTEISELTSLGLVQMTRKRTSESLEHILCVTCPLCHHRGSIKSRTTVTLEIFRDLKRNAELFSWPGFLIVASQMIIDWLLTNEATKLAELEDQLGKHIKLRVESSYTQERFDILPGSEKE